MNDSFAVVLAGGFGTRLWPLSRRHRPKQFLDLTGDGSMLRVTVSRLLHLLPIQRILVTTVPDQVPLVRQTLPELSPDNLIVEPVKRGTGPCVGLAALHLERIFLDAAMLVVPADHLILDTEKYINALSTACEVASESNSLVTIGLEPVSAATSYGYIRKGTLFQGDDNKARVFYALGFVEKPDPDVAKQLYEAGGYLWNTGTFAWSVKSLQAALQRFAPELATGLEAIGTCWQAGARESEIRHLYALLPDISIDYALMEHADDVFVVLGEYQRVDVGDLNALAQIWPADENQNAGHGMWVSRNSAGNIVHTSGRLVALVGVNNIIVVVTDDVVLVCARDQSQEVRTLIKELDASMGAQYL